MSELERKVWDLSEAKATDSGHGSFSGYASLFGVKDAGGDVVTQGAFADTLPQFVDRGFIAWGHDWNQPVATVAEAREDARGLFLKADFHSDAQSQRARTIATERLARGKFMGLSIGYLAEDADYQPDARVLKQIHLFETSLVTVPMLAPAGVTQAKAAADGVETRATWTTSYVNDLPDSAFAYIAPGGDKDAEGKTTPRSLRHFPHHDAGGAVDLPHVRNALARIPQSDVPAAAKSKAEAHVQRHLDASKSLADASASELLDALHALLDAAAGVEHARLPNLARRARQVAALMERRAAPPPDDLAAIAAAFRDFQSLHPPRAPRGPVRLHGGR